MHDEQERFRDALKTHLELLWDSCRRYDKGHKNEALRIATHLRAIFHTTTNSTSVLTHLGQESIRLLTSIDPDKPKDISKKPIVSEGGLTSFVGGKGWVAKLDSTEPQYWAEFSIWWNEQVVAIYKGHEYTRRLIVLDTANKGGGAHVDAKLPPRFSKLLEGQWTMFNPNGLSKPIANQHFEYLRQIAYEALHSKELLALAGPGFSLPSDADYAAAQKIEHEGRISRLTVLYETARSSQGNGDLETASKLADIALAEMESSILPESLELYILLVWLRASCMPVNDSGAKVQCFRKALNAFDSYAKEPLDGRLVEFLIKTQFEIAWHLIQLEERREAEELLTRCSSNVRQVLGPTPADELHKFSEPLLYLLQSANNLAVYKLRDQDFAAVVDILTALEAELVRVSAVLTTMEATELSSVLHPKFDGDVIFHLAKLYRNKTISTFALGELTAAHNEWRTMQARFAGYKDERVARYLNDVKDVLSQT